MNTNTQNEKLLAYYLGYLDEEERTQIEEELLESRVTLMSFIALKREFDLQEDLTAAPSPELKRRLARDLRITFEKVRWIQSLAAAAALLAVVAGVSLFRDRGPDEVRHEEVSGVSVDAANDVAMSLNIL